MGTGQDQTHMLAATKNGKTMVATNRGSGSISVFQLTGPDPVFPGAWKETIISVCHGPEALDINPSESEVWVGCRSSNEIAIVDLAQKQMAASFPIDTQSVARVKFASGGKYLLAADPMRGNLVFIDAAAHKVLKSVPMGRGCEAIFLEPDGTHALIGVTNDDNVAEVDLQTMSVVRRLVTGQGPDEMAWVGR
jgi:DNA-binding beta-propeller fold protein YncE